MKASLLKSKRKTCRNRFSRSLGSTFEAQIFSFNAEDEDLLGTIACKIYLVVEISQMDS